jgi:hypothetical protein
MIIGIELEGFECGVLLEGIGPGFVISSNLASQTGSHLQQSRKPHRVLKATHRLQD